MVIQPKSKLADAVDVVASPAFVSIEFEGKRIYLDHTQIAKIYQLTQAYEAANA